MPIYLNLAGGQNNPVERMKYIITATIACFHNSSVFLKPLNPILGETYETMYDDGSKVNNVFLFSSFWNKPHIILLFHIII